MRQSLDPLGFLSPSLITRGDYVDLGSLRTLLHKHNLENTFTISIKYTHPESFRRSHLLPPPQAFRKISTSFRASKMKSSRVHGDSELSRVVYTVGGSPGLEMALDRSGHHRSADDWGRAMATRAAIFDWAEEGARSSLARFVHQSAPDYDRHFFSSESNPPRFSDYMGFLSQSRLYAAEGLPARLAGFDETTTTGILSKLRIEQTLQELIQEYHQLLGTIYYLGPLRSYPARFYLAASGRKDTVGAKGEFAPQMIYQHRRKIEGDVNKWFTRFQIPYTLKVRAVGDGEVTGELIAMALFDQRTQVEVAPSDVGFGIGQLLPIIVEGVIANGRTICVEQPEIHLHPRLQASVADLLIESAGIATGDAAPNSRKINQWIIETHSEALMMRIQRRIRQGQIKHDDVSVIYVEPGEGGSGSRALPLRLDERGDFIDEWPNGFFEERYQEQFSE